MPSRWYSEGIKTNPIAGDLLADTGALSLADNLRSPNKTFKVMVSGTILARVEIQHRNAANSATLATQLLTVLADSQYLWDPTISGITLAESERIRVVMFANALGSVSASIFTS